MDYMSMMDIRLSEHFMLSEFLRSDMARRLGIDNEAPLVIAKGSGQISTHGFRIVANLSRLCIDVLEPLRRHFGVPIHINSGYRCPELNKAVGGTPNSLHMQGRAADIPMHPEWMEYIRKYLPHSELINEGEWIHVGEAP